MNESKPPSESDELPVSSSGLGAISPVPPIEAVIGHWFACGEVHIVFAEGDGRQFFLIKETRERFYGTFLDPGHDWARREEPAPLTGAARDQGMLRAYHEAGHAVACIDEGIKVEYVTIIPQVGWNGEQFLGLCQYDYRLPEALEHDSSVWAEKTAKADMGGPLADYLFRERNKVAVPEEVRYAWRNDRSKARRHLANKAAKEGKEVDLEQQLDDLFALLAARFQEPWAWAAICEIADRLCNEGAVSGQVVKELVEQAKADDGGTAQPGEAASGKESGYP